MRLIRFENTSFSLPLARGVIANLVNKSTDLTYLQKQDCIEILDIVTQDFEPTVESISRSFSEVGTNGFRVYLNYYADRDLTFSTVNAYISLEIDTETPGSNPTASAPATGVSVPPVTAAPWVQPANPIIMGRGALSANFSAIYGQSVIIPDVVTIIEAGSEPVYLDTHTLGGVFYTTNVSSNYIKATVRNSTGGEIPSYTSAVLYRSGVVAASGYSVSGALLSSINLYVTTSAITTSPYDSLTLLVTTTGSAAWVPTTSFECSGGVRFINGSCRGFVLGSSAITLDSGAYYGPNDITLTGQGCTPGTYIGKARFINSYLSGGNYQILNTGNNFRYTFNGVLSTNPTYGYVVPGSAFAATAGVNGRVIYDAIVDFTITDALTSAVIPFKIYSPYTFAVTGIPVWIQTVLPDSNNITSVTVDWGDGETDTYSTAASTTLYFAHTYSAASSVPYTAVVTGNDGSNNYTVTASQRFYIQDTYSDLNLEDYKDTLGINLTLPYSKEEVNIGSNEWAVADNINAAYSKLKENFSYLNRITDAIKKSPNMTLVEWLRDLVAFPTWNNALTGSNAYFNLSGSYTGIIPAESIVDFRSYKNGLAAPDYNNYIAFDNGLVQVRKNDFNNTIVNQLSTVAKNSTPLNVYSIDSNGTDLYVLGSLNFGGSNSLVSVYRYYLDSALTPVNQVGGSNGTLSDRNAFNNNPVPNTVKVYNNQVYVGDIGNRCIKVYNSALTYTNTIYSSELSAYEVKHFDIDNTTGNIYILGSIYAPNVPVITSVTTSAVEIGTQYRVTWNHDGERLNYYPGVTSNFNIYGSTAETDSYTLINSISSDLSIFPTLPKLTTYVFSSSSTYTSFKIEAIGIDGVITSGKSSSKIVPNDVKFPSPFKVLIYNNSSALLSSFNLLEVPSTANIKKILIDPAGKFLYVVTTENVYKFTSNGIFVNKLLSPSKSTASLGISENIVTAFIDQNYYFYLITTGRIFKFTDVPVTEEIVNTTLLDTYYTSLSTITINENEFIVDWVYNKALKPLLYNHELLAKSINSKYVITLDNSNNLSNFTTRDLSANELINSLSADESNYIYSNEIVSSAVINRTLDKIYKVQEAILNVLKPEVIRTPTSYLTNVIGLVTTTVGNIIYETSTTTTTTTTTPAPLPLLFSFASADYVGNLYSNLYNNNARYGNDYTITFSLINAASSTVLSVTVYDTNTGSATLPEIITFIIKASDTILAAYTLTYNATTINIPLSSILTSDSASLAADGIEGTFGADFEITLSLGAILSLDQIRPRVRIYSSDGRFYNTTFKNSVSSTAFSSCYVSLYGLSGDYIPYVGIANNTLGGYLYDNPYASHVWSFDGKASNADPLLIVNPSINMVPVSSSSFTVSAYRTTEGESELVLGMNRTVIEPVAVPSYFLSVVSTQTGSGGKPGGGTVNGTGYYPAGTVIPVFAVATYGTFGRFSQNVTTPPYGVLITGAGVNSNWVSGPTFVGSTAADAGGRVDGKLFVDGDKIVDVGFYHS
jgi:hypothetical protein